MREALSSLPIFPCRGNDKRPLAKRGFLDAKLGSGSNGWPLVGVATGAISGLDCLDIDAEGIGWYDREFDALPFTRAHETRSGGLHLLLRHAADSGPSRTVIPTHRGQRSGDRGQLPMSV
jgi:hypothetical protein